jgi:hypothetical protein
VTTKRLRNGVLCAVLLAMVLSTTACADRAALAELAALFLPELLSYKFTGSTGDASMDAVLQAKAVLDKIGQADALMEQGWQKGDPTVMEEAIALRPKDWSYRVDAASLYLAQDDVKEAERHLAAAEKVVPDNPQAQLRHSLKVIDQFESIKESGDSTGYTSLEQCELVHKQLVRYYDRQWALSGNQGTSPAGTQIASEGQRCAERLQP